MRFEKWQALGNDYVIVEREAFGIPLTPAVIRRLCARHLGIGADGILELLPPTEPGYVAQLRILNPDGSEAELSGNGAREALLYLVRAGWTDARQFSIQTIAGEIRATVASPSICSVDMGRAKLTSDNFPGGPDDGTGTVDAAGRLWSFRYVTIGNPQCAIHIDKVDELVELDIVKPGETIETCHLFPNRTNVSFWSEIEPGHIRARVFERGVGETMSSGTGACGAAIDYVLRGGDSPVLVALDGGELEVEVGEDLHVDLTGWARPVYAGKLAPEMADSLAELSRSDEF
jgi:diaminopimelate epimerase